MNVTQVDPPKEEGPQLVMRTSWCFILGRRDSLLMLKALGGRLTAVEVDDAKALGDRLTQLRAQEGRDYLNSLERAEAASLNKEIKS